MYIIVNTSISIMAVSKSLSDNVILVLVLIDYLFLFCLKSKQSSKISLYFVNMISQAERILKGTFKVKHFPENSLLHEQCASKLKLIRTFDVNMLTEFVLREQISVLQMWNPEVLRLTVSFHIRKSPEHH